ncbi:MAG: glycosyltransferase [Candidatus Brocadiia bacterium]
MKISCLVHDLSANSIVRTYPIAKVLERRHEIEIAGPVFGDEIYEAFAQEFTYRPVFPKGKRWHHFLSVVPSLLSKLDGDVLYAFKPIPTSFGVGLIRKTTAGVPLLLDIEDWDNASFHNSKLWKHVWGDGWGRGSRLSSPYGGVAQSITEAVTHLADGITVSSRFLRSRFGGTQVYMGVNASVFDPSSYDKERERNRFGLPDCQCALFTGKVRPHKGLKDLCDAARTLSEDLRVVVAGPENRHVEKLSESYPGAFTYLGMFPHSEMPALLAAADYVCLPQRPTPYAEAQIPAKVFEAMAMEKPIVATAVSDLPQILDGCGKVVPPQDPEALAGALNELLKAPSEAQNIGRAARRKCVFRYSWDAMEEILDPIVASISNPIGEKSAE